MADCLRRKKEILPRGDGSTWTRPNHQHGGNSVESDQVERLKRRRGRRSEDFSRAEEIYNEVRFVSRSSEVAFEVATLGGHDCFDRVLSGSVVTADVGM
jgi:hypothetical protein